MRDQAEQRARATAKAKSDARTKLNEFKKYRGGGVPSQYGDRVPLEVAQLVAEWIGTHTYERGADTPDGRGVRGVRVVARDLANLALSCKDFNQAVQRQAYHRLAEAVPDTLQLPCCGIDWDGFLRDPNRFKIKDCKDAARSLVEKIPGPKVAKIKISVTKPELVLKLYGVAFGVDRPLSANSHIPASILFAFSMSRRQANHSPAPHDTVSMMLHIIARAGNHYPCMNVRRDKFTFAVAKDFGDYANLKRVYSESRKSLILKRLL